MTTVLDRLIPRLVALCIAVAVSQCAAHALGKLALAESLWRAVLIPYSVQVGKPKPWGHCRAAVDGCRSRMALFASYFRTAGQVFGTDPWLLAAMAYHESRLNPFAVGPGGERGILQVHPRRREAKALPLFREEGERICRREPGACQLEFVMVGARVLRNSLRACEDLEGALQMYNSGRCDGNPRYARQVLRYRAKMLEGSS